MRKSRFIMPRGEEYSTVMRITVNEDALTQQTVENSGQLEAAEPVVFIRVK